MLLPGISWPGGSPENAGIIIGVVAAAYLTALWLAAILWTVRDIRSRSRDPITQLVSILLVVILSLPGWLLYLVLRPPLTLSDAYGRQLEEEAILQGLAEQFACPRCTADVRDDYVVCPQCATRLREPCTACQRALMFSWRLCPWCTKERTPKTVAIEAVPVLPRPRDRIGAAGAWIQARPRCYRGQARSPRSPAPARAWAWNHPAAAVPDCNTPSARAPLTS